MEELDLFEVNVVNYSMSDPRSYTEQKYKDIANEYKQKILQLFQEKEDRINELENDMKCMWVEYDELSKLYDECNNPSMFS